ncbi:MAG: hypothetical protein EYX74_05140 [Desulfobulbaceae bacterium]|nr:MAG: hypothetical protein EYX74_05140 [Desulfobulbaceae bacterium]
MILPLSTPWPISLKAPVVVTVLIDLSELGAELEVAAGKADKQSSWAIFKKLNIYLDKLRKYHDARS